MTWQSADKRSRPVHFHLWASLEEAALIRERMEAAGISGFGAFARKMLIDGYHVNIDLSDVHEMVRLLKNATDNINQIAKRANETRSIHAQDVDDLRRQYDRLWKATSEILRGLAKIK
jgi:hypothetical protein